MAPPARKDDELDLFHAAVGEVKKLEARPLAPRASRKAPFVSRDPPPAVPDSDAVADLTWVAPGVDRRVLRKLGGRELVPEATCDLHGLKRDEAARGVRSFIAASRERGLRLVLVVHGRGSNSPGGEPLLKRLLPGWLTSGEAAGAVLAFVGARAEHGGAGALYVLLRR